MKAKAFYTAKKESRSEYMVDELVPFCAIAQFKKIYDMEIFRYNPGIMA